MSAITALLDDGVWTLAAAHRVTIRASRLAAQIRKLMLTYRSHRLRIIAGAGDEPTVSVFVERLRQYLQIAPNRQFCDACLAIALDISLEQARALTDQLPRQSFAFPRLARTCARCGGETGTISRLSLAESGGHAEQHNRSPHRKKSSAPLDVTTEELLRELRGSPTDLAKLVRRVHERDLVLVAVSTKAIVRWQNEARGAWERVNQWLVTRGVRVIRH